MPTGQRLKLQMAHFRLRTAAFEKVDGEDLHSKAGIILYWLARADGNGPVELARVALAVLAVNPSEAAVERTFSQQRIVHSRLRSRLVDRLVEAQMMIRCNHQQLTAGWGTDGGANWLTAADADDGDDAEDDVGVEL